MKDELNSKESLRDIVISILLEWSKNNDGYWHRYKGLLEAVKERGIEVAISKLRIVMQDLKKAGIVTYEQTYNDDGQINGWGYFLRDDNRRWDNL